MLISILWHYQEHNTRATLRKNVWTRDLKLIVILSKVSIGRNSSSAPEEKMNKETTVYISWILIAILIPHLFEFLERG